MGALEPTGFIFTGSGAFSNKLEVLFQVGEFQVFDIVITDLTKPFLPWSLP